MKKKNSIVLVFLIFTLVFVYMSSTTVAEVKQRPTIKIGGLGPLAITPGNDMKNGLEMAVAEINDGDGVMVGGTAYDFELIIKTSSGDLGIPDPTVGVTAAFELIDSEDVVAIIGGFRTEVVLGIQMSTAIALDRPFLGIGASAPIVSPHFWRIGPSNVSGLARNIIDMYACGLIPDQGVRNITVIRESAAWTLAMALKIKETINLLAGAGVYGPGVTINFTDDIIIPVTDQLDDVSAAMSGLTADTYQGLNLNALCTIFSGPVGGYIPQVWAALDLPMFLAGINVESQVSTYFDETEGACYGEIELETCPPDVEPNPNTAPFRTAYFALYDEMPTYTAFASYDAVMVLKEAIEAANSAVPADIEAALVNTEHIGTAYTIKFTSEDGPHWTVAENTTTGLPYEVPILTNDTYPTGIPKGSFVVHDLYTNGSVGVDGRPYNVGYWAQWQQGGVKKTVWHIGDPKGYNDLYSPMDSQRNLTAGNLIWPINHADHGWVPETTTTTATGTGTTTTGTGTTTTEESVEIPGFDLGISLFVLCALAVIFFRQKQKKR
ncbi:MAG: ABC transporter substrate-binding protein [Candidatus Hodarchaeota archaeon]